MKFKQIAKNLSDVIGIKISPDALKSFSQPCGTSEEKIEIARKNKVVLRGYSEETTYNSRKTGEQGKGYSAFFQLNGLEDSLISQRGYLLEEASPRETVRKALEQLLRLIEGDYSGAAFGDKTIHHSNIL